MNQAAAKKGSCITVLAPAFYSSGWPVRYLRESADRLRVPVRFYGYREPYRDWLDVQVTRLLSEIERTKTSHVLYTDASDAIFLRPLAEIELEYEDLGRPPILISREPDGVCAGGWMGERDAALDCLTEIRDKFDDSNPQIRWRKALLHSARVYGWTTIDHSSRIFQVAGADHLRVIEGERGKRLRNLRTGCCPGVLHFAGGYTDPKIGKAEIIEPLWIALGYTPTVDPTEEPALD